MDCQLEGRPLRDQALRCLRTAARVSLTTVVPGDLVLGAREPVMRLEDSRSGKVVDVTVNGHHVLQKSNLIRRYMQCEPVRALTRFVKAWAKTHGFYGYQRHYHLTGYGYTLLVIHFFQSCYSLPTLPVVENSKNNVDVGAMKLVLDLEDGVTLAETFVGFCAFYCDLW